MSAPKTFLVRSGMSPAVTAEGVVVLGDRVPDIYARVDRLGFLRRAWEIVGDPAGVPLKSGTAFTEGGARVSAIAAAHRPGIGKEAAR